jgi:hypothetical protein
MEYDYPLMRDEFVFYVTPGDVDVDELLHSKPGGIVRVSSPEVHGYRAVREWWEPIEDEL